MSYFPFFVNTESLRGVIIGGGKVALEKVERLLAFDAKLTLVSKEICTELRQYGDRLLLLEKEYAGSDLDTADYVIAATDNPQLNEQIYRDAKARRLLINVVDVPESCDFIFPSVLQRGKLVVGVSSCGAAPRVAIRLRDRVAASIPNNIEEILDILAEERIRAKEEIPDAAERRAYLISLADRLLDHET